MEASVGVEENVAIPMRGVKTCTERRVRRALNRDGAFGKLRDDASVCFGTGATRLILLAERVVAGLTSGVWGMTEDISWPCAKSPELEMLLGESARLAH